MRLFFLLLLPVVALAEDIPPTKAVMDYLTTKTQAVCGKTPPNAGFLASQLRLVCLRDHHHDHDWHACADVVATGWCASH